ncbi:MAG: 1-acyl-sn-glycerol-3-phosphate acyltransferase [Frankiaceae bacterium]|nr:1-acyl-sn-glycerol-3-phosphate acyltransferase [Frankiaceae bacterium]
MTAGNASTGAATKRRRVPLRRLGFWYGLAACILKPLTWAFMKRDWRGLEHVPREGGVILAVNHISHADPIAVADYIVYGTGRIARFLAKSTLFKGKPLVSQVMRGAGQIPVHRHTADASLALSDAVAALRKGECVAIFPEGTVSRDPDKWPMLAKTGVARLALLSGVPVVPVAQWGAEQILDSYRTKGLHLLPRHTMHIVAGPPVDLSAYAGKELTTEVLRGATDEVMWAVTRLLEPLRGEPAPQAFFDFRAAKSGPTDLTQERTSA